MNELIRLEVELERTEHRLNSNSLEAKTRGDVRLSDDFASRSLEVALIRGEIAHRIEERKAVWKFWINFLRSIFARAEK